MHSAAAGEDAENGRVEAMSDALRLADADGLRDLADRSERAARTARNAVAATEPPADAMLVQLAGHLEAAASSALALAALLEGGRMSR
jgi:hypothetical protein